MTVIALVDSVLKLPLITNQNPDAATSVVFDDDGFHCINWTHVVPMLALLFNWWERLAAMIAFDNPAPHQKVATESKTNRFMVTANGLRQYFAGATTPMARGVEIEHLK